MSVDKSDLELTVGEIAKISLRGAKNPRLENSDDKVMDARLVDFVEHNGTLQIQGKAAGRATLKVIAGGTMLEIKVTVQAEEPNNPLNGKNIVWDKISSDDYELSADGLTLIRWRNESTQNLDMNRDSRLRKITSIGKRAFEGCWSLISINIPSSVTSIEAAVFSGCSSLTSVTIPSSVTSIEAAVFSGCRSLTSVTIPSSVTSIGKSAFSGCHRLTSVTIPSSVTSIEASAFYFCNSLTSINIPSSVTSIGDGAFSSCYSLTSVTIPSSVTSIGWSAFDRCWRLTSINIPSSVTNIGGAAFADCSSLTSVTIPSSVISIGSWAFRNCRSLTSVVFKGNKPPMKESGDYFPVFEDTPSSLKLIVPKGAKGAYIDAGYSADKLVEE